MSLPLFARQRSDQGLVDYWLSYLQKRQIRLATALVYLALIALAELVVAYAVPQTPQEGEIWKELALVGLTLHGGLLVILLLHSSLASGQPYQRLLLGLSLAPLTRILSLSLPLVGFPLLYWYLVISVPLFVATIMVARVSGFSRAEMGLTIRKIPAQFLVIPTGLVFGLVEYFILRPGPLIASRTFPSILVSSLILVVCTGFAEELIFRGVIQRASVQALGRFGLLYVALLFAVLHIGYRSVPDVIFVFVVALVFGWVAESTWSLLGISLAHGLTNIVLFLILPYWLG
jgi:membrane protease YdiL (CAAX protease family)